MTKVKNISGGPRGIYTKDQGLVMLEKGEARDLDLADGEDNEDWFSFDGAGEGLSGHTVAELREIAETENIDLGDATRKADVIAAIELARGE